MDIQAIKVLLIESQPLYREGLKALLSKQNDIEVIDGAGQNEEILEQIHELSPDVVLLVPRPASADSFALVRRIKLYSRALPVIVLAESQDQDALLLSIKSGAAAYLTKDTASEELLEAIRRTFHGEYLIDEKLFSNPRIASSILGIFQEMAEPEEPIKPFLSPLSPREITVLDLIAQGNSNKDIARRLSISEQTVKNHVASIMRKLVANDRTHAVVIALRQGLIKLG